MEVTGILRVKGAEQKVSDKFKKREIVITTDHDRQYPQHVPMQLTQDRCGIVDQFSEGDEVRAHINLRGRDYKDKETNETKYFGNIEIWKLDLIRKAGAEPAPAASAQGTAASPADDLPF